MPAISNVTVTKDGVGNDVDIACDVSDFPAGGSVEVYVSDPRVMGPQTYYRKFFGVDQGSDHYLADDIAYYGENETHHYYLLVKDSAGNQVANHGTKFQPHSFIPSHL